MPVLPTILLIIDRLLRNRNLVTVHRGRNDDSLNRSREHEDCLSCGCNLEGVNGYSKAILKWGINCDFFGEN